MTDIEQLIKKYQSPYIPGEKRSNQFNNHINREYRHEERLLTLDHLNNELPYSLKLNKHEKELATSILQIFKNDLQSLHRRAKNEAIILTIIFIIKKRIRPSLQLNKDNRENKQFTELAEKYNLTENMLITIISRITNYYIITSPLIIRETTRYDQELLYKQHNPTRK